jgi:hypothetical protein
VLLDSKIFELLDIDIYRTPDGLLGYKVYRRPICTNLYLNSGFHHHSSSKHKIISTLMHTARALHDQDSLHCMLEFLTVAVRQNSYSNLQIHRTRSSPPRVDLPHDYPYSVTSLPYMGSTFNHTGNSTTLKFIGLLLRNISSFWLAGDE